MAPVVDLDEYRRRKFDDRLRAVLDETLRIGDASRAVENIHSRESRRRRLHAVHRPTGPEAA